MQTDTDIIVAGAGIVGSTAALLLADIGLSVVVIDAKKRETWQAATSGTRVSAINIASENVLREARVWGAVVRRCVSPFKKMFVWETGKNGQISFDAANVAQLHLGHIIENDVLVDALHSALVSRPNLTLCEGVEIDSIRLPDEAADQMTADLSNGQSFNARLLIGADGARSKVRQQSGLNTNAISYEQKAIVAKVQTQHPHEQTAWQRFLNTGPLAFLPLQDGSSSIVWSCDSARADEILALGTHDFEQALESAFESKLGSVSLISERGCFPLFNLHAPRYIAQRVALLGDAAHVAHPLAGLGANLGILDAACLQEVLLSSVQKKRDPGSERLLKRYQRWRRAENALVLNGLSAFKYIFGSEYDSVRQAAALGMSTANKIIPLKSAITRYATGLAGDLPAAAKTAIQ